MSPVSSVWVRFALFGHYWFGGRCAVLLCRWGHPGMSSWRCMVFFVLRIIRRHHHLRLHIVSVILGVQLTVSRAGGIGDRRRRLGGFGYGYYLLFYFLFVWYPGSSLGDTRCQAFGSRGVVFFDGFWGTSVKEGLFLAERGGGRWCGPGALGRGLVWGRAFAIKVRTSWRRFLFLFFWYFFNLDGLTGKPLLDIVRTLKGYKKVRISLLFLIN